jgi:hypothetical protein
MNTYVGKRCNRLREGMWYVYDQQDRLIAMEQYVCGVPIKYVIYTRQDADVHVVRDKQEEGVGQVPIDG